MFYCEACREKNQWPESWSKSRGLCEVCGTTAVCNDIPSNQLPMPLSDSDKKRHAELRQRLGQ
jgi:hypothetical protein